MQITDQLENDKIGSDLILEIRIGISLFVLLCSFVFKMLVWIKHNICSIHKAELVQQLLLTPYNNLSLPMVERETCFVSLAPQ